MDTTAIFILYCWIMGISIALLLGNYLTHKFVKWMRLQIVERAIKLGEKEIKAFTDAMERTPSFPIWLVGTCERLFFLILVAFNFPGTAIAMMGWIAVKMLYNWAIIVPSQDVTVTDRHLALSALMGNMCSMFFALIGGLICRYPFCQ